jgi:hypothetical protein
MSSYHDLPRQSKIAGRQHGLKRLSVHSSSMVGCPKLIEVWVPESKWIDCAPSIVQVVFDAVVKLHGVDESSLYIST